MRKINGIKINRTTEDLRDSEVIQTAAYFASCGRNPGVVYKGTAEYQAAHNELVDLFESTTDHEAIVDDLRAAIAKRHWTT